MKHTCGVICVGENSLIRYLVGREPVLLDRDSLRAAMEQKIGAGIREFAVLMDEGGGLLAAETALALKREHPGLRLTCLMRWEEQAASWPEPLRDRWFDAFAACDEELLVEPRRSTDNLKRCIDCLRERSSDWVVFCEPSAEGEETAP